MSDHLDSSTSNQSPDTPRPVYDYAAEPAELRPKRPVWELLSLALPTVAQMASYTVMQFTDTYMLSRVGDTEATAAGMSGFFGFAVISLGFGVMMIVNTLVSQSVGREDYSACGQYLWQGIWTALLFGVLALPLLPFAGGLFDLMGHRPDLAALEASYFRITVGLSAFKLAGGALGQFMLAIQRPNTVLFSAVCGCVANIFANWLLIYGHWGFPAMGVDGAAWGTNIAIVVEMSVLIGFVATPRITRLYNTGDWRLRVDKMRTLLVIGIPSGVQIVAEVLAWSLFTNVVMNRFDATALAANLYAFRYMAVSFMPAFGISQAVTALVGRYIGRGRPDVAVQRAHLGFKICAVYMIACGVGFYVFRRDLMHQFSRDPAVLAAGEVLLIFVAVYQLFDALYIVYNGGLRGAGDTFVPAIVTAALCWSMCVFGAYYIAVTWPQWGIAGPWTIATLYGGILGAYLFMRFVRGKWREIRLEEEPEAQSGAQPAVAGE